MPNNFAVAYVYFANEPGRRATAGLMTKDEARRSRPASPSGLTCLALRNGKTATRLCNEGPDRRRAGADGLLYRNTGSIT